MRVVQLKVGDVRWLAVVDEPLLRLSQGFDSTCEQYSGVTRETPPSTTWPCAALTNQNSARAAAAACFIA